jgi:anaerobic dimethyl sulfoxide reductase subunit B (iron-sulfur subunit)
MAQFAFFFDGTRCNGCKTCVMSCKDLHDLPAERSFGRVYEYEKTSGWTVDENGFNIPGEIYGYFVSLSCNHCDSPACVAACPTGACMKDEESGVVSIDEEICIGSGECVTACPYFAPSLNEETNKGEKCDGCAARVAEGMAPMCVEACPQRALTFGDASEVPEGFERANIAPLPGMDGTMPNMYIKASKSAAKAGDTAGHVANLPETM